MDYEYIIMVDLEEAHGSRLDVGVAIELCHDFHGCADDTLWMSNQIPRTHIMRMLGHSNIE